jgi:protein involved in polysaccharide export with SLBB domain
MFRSKLVFLLLLFIQGLATPFAFAQGSPMTMEAPLISGNLGKATEATNIGGNFAAGLGGAVPGAPGQLKGSVGTTSPVQTSANQGAQERPLPSLIETRFQQFVEDSTGKKLSLYGYNLFDSSRFPSLTDVPVPANYVVGPGDEVDLKLWGMAELSVRLPVDRMGQIVIPRVGPVTVAGTRVDQLEPFLKSQVAKVFTNFELSAGIGKLRSVQVFVVGQARRPGAYMVSSLSTLISALFESGGPAATGSLRNIQLTRGGKLVTTLDLYNFIHKGDSSKDARLLPGDVIVIPPAGPRVALMGETDSAGIYELVANKATTSATPQAISQAISQSSAQAVTQTESIEQLFAYSGGQRTLVATHKVQLERVEASRVKGPRVVETAALDAKGLATQLRDGDILTLLKISPEFANAVTLRGNVAAATRHVFVEGMRISDLIPEPQALVQSDYFTRKNRLVQYESGKDVALSTALASAKASRDEVNWDYATIERTDPDKLVTTLIPFNLAKAVKSRDPAHNLNLKAGDVITVFSVSELPPPLEKRSRYVRVTGEVGVPGIYQLKGSETLTEVLAIAGGLTHNAYLYGTVLTRESARAQQQENLNRAIRRFESDIETKTSAMLQNTTGDKSVNEALLAQQSSQRQLLRRLESLKSSGRVSLEMDPALPRLPLILLEDADEIFIPQMPSFVGVFGAVLTESSMMHRPAAKVQNYVDRAGPTREADLDEVIIIRADGTAESTPKGLVRKNLWGASVLDKKLYPGDSVFVPEVVDKRTPYTAFIQGAKDWTQLIYQMGLGAVAFKTLRQ